MTRTKFLTSSALIMLPLLSAQPTIAGELSANLGILSTYVSRGINLSGDKITLSPGIHYQGDNGFYTGFQAYTEGNTDPYFEIDGYVGYDKQFSNGFGVNASLLTYQFPYAEQFPDHFEEVSLKGRYGNEKVQVQVEANRFMNSIVKGDTYYGITATKPLNDKVSVSASAGHYNYAKANEIDPFTGESLDYNNYQVSASWKEFTLALDHNDNQLYDIDNKVILSWKKHFKF